MKSLSDSVDWKKAQRLRNSGKSLHYIALLLGVSEASVRNYTVKRKKPENDRIPIDFGKAQALINAGWSLNAVASELETSKAVIRKNTRPKVKRAVKPLEGIFGGYP